MNYYYFRGVGVGLLIAWVTTAIGYWRTRKTGKTDWVWKLIVLEFVIDCAVFAISLI